MEEKHSIEAEKKSFSVLERFRQLKKEKEQTPVVNENDQKPQISEMVLQASSSGGNSSTPDNYRGGRRGRPHLKRNFNENSNKRATSEMHVGQKEEDVGITEYLRKGPGFEVILKHRYTDFHVNEIDLGGKVVRLTSTEIPGKDEDSSETLSNEEDPTILTPEQWDSLREIVDKGLDTTVDIDVTLLDKEQRQRIHKAVKKRFGVHIYSNTVDVNHRKVAKIGYSLTKKDQRFCNWPKGRPGFLHFVLFKENTDMTEVVSVLSKMTMTRPSKFGYAGNKDKRSVSTQQMCVQRGDVEKFGKCQRSLRAIAIGNYCYKWSNLRLGDLSGNRFKIALRNIKASDDFLRVAIEEFQNLGFINYFGLQRFGQSLIVPTYLVGKAILQKNWELAAELILKPRPGESCFYDVKQAREVWWETRDPVAALQLLTRKDKSIEGKILLGLKKNGAKAYQNAFDNLPVHTATLYLHAYQSLVWNKVVSRRVKEFGLKVLPGDLVQVKQQEREEQDFGDSGSEDENEVKVTEEFQPKVQVRTLSAEEADTASIYDVLYPLPGDDIRLPDNKVAQWFLDTLAEDGFTLDTFGQVHEKYGMYGAYRYMLEKAEDLNWQTMNYSNPDDDLLLSDFEVLRGKPPPVMEPEGPYKALILEFNLKTCCYATMAVRELAKCETSTSSQAKLTNLAREEDQATKRQKEEVENEQNKKMKTDNASQEENTNINLQDSDEKCGMKTDSENVNNECSNENEESDNAKEEIELNKREAEADNLINKYLEVAYH